MALLARPLDGAALKPELPDDLHHWLYRDPVPRRKPLPLAATKGPPAP